MIMNKFTKKGVLGVFILAALFYSPALAALSLDIGTVTGPDGFDIPAGTIKNNNLLEAFWTTDAGVAGTNPSLSPYSMKIAGDLTEFKTNPANNITDTPPKDAPDKYFAYKTDGGYYFWRFSEDSAPGGTVYVRLWDSSKNYYAYKSYANGAKSDNPQTLKVDKADWYKKDAPYTPLITKFEESVVEKVKGGEGQTAYLNVYSEAPPATDGKREITGYSWKSGEVADNLQPVGGLTSGTLKLFGSSLVQGTTYYFQAVYSNWFDDSSSAVAEHTYGGAAGVQTVTLDLKSLVDTNKTGINDFSVPFDTIWYAYDASGTPIKTNPALPDVAASYKIEKAFQLVRVINTAADKKVVSTFAYWDSAEQQVKGTMIAYDEEGNLTEKPVGDFKGLDQNELVKDRVYQVYVDTDVKVIIKDTAPTL